MMTMMTMMTMMMMMMNVVIDVDEASAQAVGKEPGDKQRRVTHLFQANALHVTAAGAGIDDAIVRLVDRLARAVAETDLHPILIENDVCRQTT